MSAVRPVAYFNSLWRHMATQAWVNIGSSNGLLPDGIKQLPQSNVNLPSINSMFRHHYEKIWRHQSVKTIFYIENCVLNHIFQWVDNKDYWRIGNGFFFFFFFFQIYLYRVKSIQYKNCSSMGPCHTTTTYTLTVTHTLTWHLHTLRSWGKFVRWIL